MAKDLSKEVKAAEKIAAVQSKPKERDQLSKKLKKHLVKPKKLAEESYDYISEVKRQLTYGDTGHGILLDKKV